MYICNHKATQHKKEFFCAEFSIPYEEICFNEVVGRGSYGSVYKGHLKGNIVALKRIPVPHGANNTELIADNREIAALRYHYTLYFREFYMYNYTYIEC